MAKVDLQYKRFEGQVKSFDDKTLMIEHFISTEKQDSVGDIMLADGMKLRGTPVVLFQHGLDAKFGNEPIAKVLGITPGVNKDGTKGLIAKTQYYDGSKLNPPDATGQRLYEKAKTGIMPNWSIGFNSTKEHPTKGGRVVDEWELFEYSQVAVACNDECTTLGKEGDAPELKFIVQEVTPEGKCSDSKDETVEEGDEKAGPESNITGQIAWQKCHDGIKMVHEGMVNEMHKMTWSDEHKDFEAGELADVLTKDAASLHAPYIKEFIDHVRGARKTSTRTLRLESLRTS
jgi:hypothetical protein